MTLVTTLQKNRKKVGEKFVNRNEICLPLQRQMKDEEFRPN